MPLSRKHFRRSRDAPGLAEAGQTNISAGCGQFNYIDVEEWDRDAACCVSIVVVAAAVAVPAAWEAAP